MCVCAICGCEVREDGLNAVAMYRGELCHVVCREEFDAELDVELGETLDDEDSDDYDDVDWVLESIDPKAWDDGSLNDDCDESMDGDFDSAMRDAGFGMDEDYHWDYGYSDEDGRYDADY